jgi:hypothetical protein
MEAISAERDRFQTLVSVVAWSLLLLVAAAGIYEAAIALGAVEIGSVPGEGAAGHGRVLAAGLLALLAAGVLFAVCVEERVRAAIMASRAAPLLCLAAASFVIGRFYSYDPYYAPTLRRMSDGGLLAGWLVAGVVALALVAAVGTARGSRAALIAVSLAMWLCAFCVQAAPGGH